MAPKKSKMVFYDGWYHSLTNKWSGHKWANWPEKRSEADWACHICDSYKKGEPDTYEGNYGSEKYCRECGGHKGETNHMTMAERWEKSQRALSCQEKKPRQQEFAGKKNTMQVQRLVWAGPTNRGDGFAWI